MSESRLRRLRRRAARWLSPPAPRPELQALKLRAIDFAVRRTGARTLADLGGVWAVEGGYAVYAHDRHDLDAVTLVDTGITPAVRRRAASRTGLSVVEGNLADAGLAERVGPVDAVLLFDVLLHQVDPDWDEVLKLWAPLTSCVVVVQPCWVRTAETTRLIELGERAYLDAVPDEHLARRLFSRLDEIHPRYDRPWRDVHEVWQWGITVDDLRDRLADLGLTELLHVDDGTWNGLEAFDTHALVAARGA